MKTMRNVLRYQTRSYLVGSRYIMPCAVLLVLEALLYAIAKVRIADSYTASSAILFFVMIWMGLAYTDAEDPVGEQLLVLGIGSHVRHQVYVSVFLALVGTCLAAFATAYPLVANLAFQQGGLFHTPVTASGVLWGFLLHVAVAFMGSAVGMLLHPRIMKDRKMAVLFTLFIGLVGFIKAGIHRVIPASRAVTWLFPPMSDLSERFAGQDVFDPGSLLLMLGLCLLYGAAMTAIRVWLLNRRRF